LTHIGGVPTIAMQILDHPNFKDYDTSSVRSVSYGGAPAPPELVKRICAAFDLGQPGNGYGLTETSAAVAMNAGGHGSDMDASVHSLVAWSSGGTRTWTHDELAFRYRASALGRGELVTKVTLHLASGDNEAAQEQIREIVRWRRANQPGGANAGSAFRNPEGDYAGRLIEASGCKGLRIGTAVVSEKHANFIIADAFGRANDVYELLLTLRQRVLDSSGVLLKSEHRFLGFEAVE